MLFPRAFHRFDLSRDLLLEIIGSIFDVVLTLFMNSLFWPKLGRNGAEYVVKFPDGLLLLAFHASDPDARPLHDALTPDWGPVLRLVSTVQDRSNREDISIPSDNGVSLCRGRPIYACLSCCFRMPLYV